MVADSYTSMKGMACNNYRWKAANQSKDWRIRRSVKFVRFENVHGSVGDVLHHLVIWHTYGNVEGSDRWQRCKFKPNVYFSITAKIMHISV